MRLFESIGLGTFLISEEGNYPEGFEQGVDFYTYHDFKSLETQIEKVLADWPYHQQMAKNTQDKISKLYSKEKQWLLFQDYISKL
jgi:spore maturation protein CgeB